MCEELPEAERRRAQERQLGRAGLRQQWRPLLEPVALEDEEE